MCPDNSPDSNSTSADVHLPSRKNCSLLFLQQMAEGTKKTIDRSKVPSNSVPQWPELSVKLLSGLVMADLVLKDYFPDKFRSGKLPERDFFWGRSLRHQASIRQGDRQGGHGAAQQAQGGGS